MNQNTRKYFESYALFSLVNNYDSMLEKMEKSDKPDLQSQYLNIGIEVTESINKKKGNERFHLNRFFGRNLSPNEVLRLSNETEALKGKVEIIAGLAVYSHYDGLFDTSIIFDAIRKSIIDKTSKLNKNYKIFKNNWLYIFSGTSLVEKYDLEIIYNSWPVDDVIHNFDRIFINCYDRIFVVDKNKIITIIQLSDAEQRRLNRISRESSSCLETNK